MSASDVPCFFFPVVVRSMFFLAPFPAPFGQHVQTRSLLSPRQRLEIIISIRTNYIFYTIRIVQQIYWKIFNWTTSCMFTHVELCFEPTSKSQYLRYYYYYYYIRLLHSAIPWIWGRWGIIWFISSLFKESDARRRAKRLDTTPFWGRA